MDLDLDPAGVRRRNMGHPETDVSRLIEHARQARPGALDQLLTAYLNYLRLLAILRLRTPAESTSRSMGY